MKRLSVAISLALCVAVPASAQLYKWVDSDGTAQYSDKPPPGDIKPEILREPAGTVSMPAAGEGKSEAKKAAEQEQAFRKRQLDAANAQEEEARKEAEAQNRAENCRRARAALASIEIGGRQTRIDDKGERVFLDDQEIEQATVRARQEAAAACP